MLKPRPPMTLAMMPLLGAVAGGGCTFIRPPSTSTTAITVPFLGPSVCSSLAAGTAFPRSLSPLAERPPTMAFSAALCTDPSGSAAPTDGYFSERAGRWVRLTTHDGVAEGLVSAPSSKPLGVKVLFCPIGQRPEDPLMHETAARLTDAGYVTLRVLRHERADGVHLSFDPKAEAARGAALGEHIRKTCGIGAPVGFVGASLGGAEALIAGHQQPRSPVVVMDPLIDIHATVRWLESWSPSVSRCAMRDYFRALVQARYGLPSGSLVDALQNVDSGSTDLENDMPVGWLRAMAPDWWAHVHVFLSEWDYALGSAGRDVFDDHPASVTTFPVEGHLSLCCLRGAMDRVVERLIAPPGTQDPEPSADGAGEASQ